MEGFWPKPLAGDGALCSVIQHDTWSLSFTDDRMNARSFYGQLPFLAVSVLITAFKMPSSLNQAPPESTKSKLQKIDFLGIITFTATIFLLLFLLQSVDYDTIDQPPLFYLLGGLFVGVGSIFLLIEMYWAM